jgi:hypothetical protein
VELATVRIVDAIAGKSLEGLWRLEDRSRENGFDRLVGKKLEGERWLAKSMRRLNGMEAQLGDAECNGSVHGR